MTRDAKVTDRNLGNHDWKAHWSTCSRVSGGSAGESTDEGSKMGSEVISGSMEVISVI